jgi:hypothetical protein
LAVVIVGEVVEGIEGLEEVAKEPLLRESHFC